MSRPAMETFEVLATSLSVPRTVGYSFILHAAVFLISAVFLVKRERRIKDERGKESFPQADAQAQARIRM
jgi:hypothetical protein